MTFHVYRRERSHRTNIFTRSAADAGSFVDSGDRGRQIVVRIRWNHCDGSSRTMTLAVATLSLTLGRGALTDHDDGMTNLYARLIDGIDGLDGSCRTHLRTACTLRTAPAAIILHHRLHQAHQAVAGAQHAIRTLRDAELTARATCSHILGRQRSWRRQRRQALRTLLGLDSSQTAIHQLVLSQCGGSGHSGCQEEGALGRVNIRLRFCHLHLPAIGFV